MEKIVEKVKSGDPIGVEMLYKQNSNKVRKYLTYKLPTSHDAEEITNEVFLEAIETINLLKDDEKLESWLMRIAHNKMVDFYRKKKINSVLLSQIPYIQILAKEINEPEFQFEKNIIKQKIENTFLKLSNNHQKIIILHYEESIPVKELASIFGLSFKATESLLFRARKSFQIAYERG